MIAPRSLTIIGNGAVQKASATSLKAKWVQALTASGNAANVLIGAGEVTSTVGFPLPANYAGQLLPPIAELSEFYDLSNLNIYAAQGDVIYLLYGG